MHAIKDKDHFFTSDCCGAGATFLPGPLNIFVVRYAEKAHATRVLGTLRKHLPDAQLEIVAVPALTVEEQCERDAHQPPVHRRPCRKRGVTHVQ